MSLLTLFRWAGYEEKIEENGSSCSSCFDSGLFFPRPKRYFGRVDDGFLVVSGVADTGVVVVLDVVVVMVVDDAWALILDCSVAGIVVALTRDGLDLIWDASSFNVEVGCGSFIDGSDVGSGPASNSCW